MARRQDHSTPLEKKHRQRTALALGSGLIVSLLLINGVVSLVTVFQQVPPTQAVNAQQETLVNDLLRAHLTRFYTDYWTCNRAIFQSDERIVCIVLNEQLQQGLNRYPLYQRMVQDDPQAAYVFETNSAAAVAMAKRAARTGIHYRVFQLDGYTVFEPT
jgi:hypothetical protein